MFYGNIPLFDSFADVVMADVDVFDVGVMFRVLC